MPFLSPDIEKSYLGLKIKTKKQKRLLWFGGLAIMLVVSVSVFSLKSEATDDVFPPISSATHESSVYYSSNDAVRYKTDFTITSEGVDAEVKNIKVKAEYSTGNAPSNLTNKAGLQSGVATVSDEQGGGFAAWKDLATSMLMAQRFNSGGEPLWTAGGVALFLPHPGDINSVSAENLGLVIDKVEGQLTGNLIIYSPTGSQKVSSDGQLLWGSSGVVGGVNMVVSDNNGGIFTVWSDGYSGPRQVANSDIYFRHISSDGTVGSTVNLTNNPYGTEMETTCSFASGIAPDGNGGVILVSYRAGVYTNWDDEPVNSGCSFDPITQEVANVSSGGVIGVPTSLGWQNQITKVVSDGQGGVIAGGTQKIFRRDSSLGLVWETSIGDDNSCADLISDDQDGVIMAWHDWSTSNMKIQRFGPMGTQLWGGGSPIVILDHTVSGMKLSLDETGGVLMSWGNPGSDVYTQKIGSDGTIQWGDGGIRVTNDGQKYTPSVVSGENNANMVFWMGYPTQFSDSDIYMQIYNNNGSALERSGDDAIRTGTISPVATGPDENGYYTVSGNSVSFSVDPYAVDGNGEPESVVLNFYAEDNDGNLEEIQNILIDDEFVNPYAYTGANGEVYIDTNTLTVNDSSRLDFSSSTTDQFDFSNYIGGEIISGQNLHSVNFAGTTVNLGRGVKLNVNGDNLIINNSQLSGGLVGANISIPDNTTIFGSSSWNGVIAPPRNANYTNNPLRFRFGSFIMEIGSTSEALFFDKAVTITINENTNSPYYYTPVAPNAWRKISSCAGSFDFPEMPIFPGECYVSRASPATTKIYTYHFTAIAELIASGASSYSPPSQVPPTEPVTPPVEPTIPTTPAVPTTPAINTLEAILSSSLPSFPSNWGIDYPGGRDIWANAHRKNIYNLYIDYLGRTPSIVEVNWQFEHESNIETIKYFMLRSNEYNAKQGGAVSPTPISNIISNTLEEVLASPIPTFPAEWGMGFGEGKEAWAQEHRRLIYQAYVDNLSRRPTIAEVNWQFQHSRDIFAIRYSLLVSDEFKSKWGVWRGW